MAKDDIQEPMRSLQPEEFLSMIDMQIAQFVVRRMAASYSHSLFLKRETSNLPEAKFSFSMQRKRLQRDPVLSQRDQT
jgi:hypothetical protein